MSDPSVPETDPAKLAELEKEVERLNREKAEIEAQAAAEQAKAAAEADAALAKAEADAMAADQAKLDAEARMKAELDAQKLAAAEKEEKEKSKRKLAKSRNRKIIGGFIALIVLILVILLATSTVTVGPGGSSSYPYTASYNVWIPLGETVYFGSNQLIALASGNEMMVSIKDQPTVKLEIGQSFDISNQRATLSTLFGKVPIMTVNYKINLEYNGITENGKEAFFRSQIQTDKSVPDFLIKLLLPQNVVAVAA